MLEHAIEIEEHLDRPGSGEPIVWMSLTGDAFLRSSTWARWQLGISLPAD